MHAGIRPAGPRQGYLLSGYGQDGLFELPLDGAIIFLALPAVVAGAVILDGDFKIFDHCRIKPCSYQQRKRQRKK
jgi:hypothetical protein